MKKAIKNYHKNPRKITDKQRADLKSWLRELGDLSGIVHDLNSDEIISGNQRSNVIDINRCEIDIGPEHLPDEQGTVAMGYVVWEGQRYNYRQVRWTEKQREKACIVANKAGGGWDKEILASDFEMDDLLEWGWSEEELLDLDFSDVKGDGGPGGDVGSGAVRLADKFILPPFSVLNAREGWWQDRKRTWLSLGIKSELGRGGG